MILNARSYIKLLQIGHIPYTCKSVLNVKDLICQLNLYGSALQLQLELKLKSSILTNILLRSRLLLFLESVSFCNNIINNRIV